MKKIILGLFVFCFTVGFGQDIWTNYLNGSIVSSYAQQNNILWVGTNGGLFQMDLTSNTKVFLNKANSGLPGNNILSLSSGQIELWVGTDAGLARYSESQWTAYDTRNSGLPSNTINDIAIGPSGIYVATDKGLAIFSNNTWLVYDSSNSELPGNWVGEVDIDKNGMLWLCLNDAWGFNGVGGFDGQSWNVLLEDGKPTLYIDALGNKWVGTEYSGIYRYDTEDKLVVYDNLPTNCIDQICGDQEGNIWAALNDLWGSNGALAKFDGIDWTYYNKENSGFAYDEIHTVFADQTDHIWFNIMKPWNGIIQDGYALAKFNKVAFETYNTSNCPLPPLTIDDLIFDRNQKAWIDLAYSVSQQFGGGLYTFDGNSWQKFQTWNSGLPCQNITGMAVDIGNNLWFSAYHMTNSGLINEGGVIRFDGSNWTYFSKDNSVLKTYAIRDIATDNKNNIWISGDGLYQIDSLMAWSHFTTSNSNLPINYIRQIEVDPEDHLWITDGISLYKHTANEWNRIPIHPNSGFINDFVIDGEDILWVALEPEFNPDSNAYFGGGLLKNDEFFSFYDTTNSDIPSNWINRIAVDSSKNIWIGTNNGLCKFDRNKFTCFTDSNSALSGNEISAIETSLKGEIWIGTIYNGISVLSEKGINGVFSRRHDHSLKIFPNPFTNHTSVELPESIAQKAYEVELFSLSGKKMNIQIENTGNRLDLKRGSLSNGIYFLVIRADEKSYVNKIVLN